MTLDNALPVAGVAHGRLWAMVFGLALSISFVELVPAFIARILARNHQIGYFELIVMAYVCISMIHESVIREDALQAPRAMD